MCNILFFDYVTLYSTLVSHMTVFKCVNQNLIIYLQDVNDNCVVCVIKDVLRKPPMPVRYLACQISGPVCHLESCCVKHDLTGNYIDDIQLMREQYRARESSGGGVIDLQQNNKSSASMASESNHLSLIFIFSFSLQTSVQTTCIASFLQATPVSQVLCYFLQCES